MYNSIKLAHLHGDGLDNIKTSIRKGALVALHQEIVLTFLRHFVVKRRVRGYFMVVEYLCPRGEVLYEIVVSPSVRYYSILGQKMQSIT